MAFQKHATDSSVQKSKALAVILGGGLVEWRLSAGKNLQTVQDQDGANNKSIVVSIHDHCVACLHVSSKAM